MAGFFCRIFAASAFLLLRPRCVCDLHKRGTTMMPGSTRASRPTDEREFALLRIFAKGAPGRAAGLKTGWVPGARRGRRAEAEIQVSAADSSLADGPAIPPLAALPG